MREGKVLKYGIFVKLDSWEALGFKNDLHDTAITTHLSLSLSLLSFSVFSTLDIISPCGLFVELLLLSGILLLFLYLFPFSSHYTTLLLYLTLFIQYQNFESRFWLSTFELLSWVLIFIVSMHQQSSCLLLIDFPVLLKEGNEVKSSACSVLFF